MGSEQPEETTVTTSCKLCKKLIYMEDEPLHFNCMTARENCLIQMVMSLHDQLNAMKESFISVESVLKSLMSELNLGNSEYEFIPETDVQPRSIRQTTLNTRVYET